MILSDFKTTTLAISDGKLGKLGTHADLLSVAGCSQMRGGELTAEMRSRVLTWFDVTLTNLASPSRSVLIEPFEHLQLSW